MIKAKFFKRKNGEFFGFEIFDHGEGIVCSAVSALSLNTVNSIEKFTDVKYKCEFDNDGGYLYLELDDDEIDDKAVLLLDSLYLGLYNIKDSYVNEISLIIEEVG